jgi:hypothetical protein
MKEVRIIRRESAILSPSEVWGCPDNVAEQLIRRGSGKLVEPEKPNKKYK